MGTVFLYQDMPPSTQCYRAESPAPAPGVNLGVHRKGYRRRDTELFHPDPLAQHPVHAGSSTRRVSASFADGPSTCQPTLATSSLTASNIPASHTYTGLPMARTAHRYSRILTPTNIPIPEPSIATTYMTATVAPHGPYNDENAHPKDSTLCLHSGLRHKHKNSFDIAAMKLRAKTKTGHLSSLPKSNTLHAFSNLTASFSRNSLSKFARSTSISSIAEPETDISVTSRSTAPLLISDGTDPRRINRAQSSAYWTGRFMALQDRFHNATLLPENLVLFTPAHDQHWVATDHSPLCPEANMPGSTSKPALPQVNARGHRYSTTNFSIPSKGRTRNVRESIDTAPTMDEEDQARKAFLQLDALCTTSEARRSLHAWQQIYARKTGREELLPQGGSMEDKGWMGRLLGRDVAKRNSIANDA